MTTCAKLSIDDVYEALCRTCDVLEALGCNYFLAGGTLLGARRSGDLIAHDIDFDLDCLIAEEKTILAASDLFAERGLRVSRQMSLSPRRLLSNEGPSEPLYCSCLHIEYQGRRAGDIYVYTIFSDGVARRFDLSSGMYANAKMAIPGWYYSPGEYLTIRGRKFQSVRAPDMVLEKIYGADWRTPLKPGEFAQDRNSTSGSVPDADIEKLMLYALEQGWSGAPHDAPVWPQNINWVGWPARVSREWVFRHEPMIHAEIASLLNSDIISRLASSGDAESIRVFARVVAAKAIQIERTQPLRFLSNRSSNDRSSSNRSTRWLWAKRLFMALPIPTSWKTAVRNLYASISKRTK